MTISKISAHGRHGISAYAFGAAALAAGLLTMRAADADLRYTQSLTAAQPVATPAAATTKPAVHLTTYVKGRRERQEITTRTGSANATTVVLTLCDTGQIVRMDQALKIYTTTAITTSPIAPFGLPSQSQFRAGGMADPDLPDAAPSPFSSAAPPASGSPFPAMKSGPAMSPAPPASGSGDTVSASPMIDGDAPPAPAPPSRAGDEAGTASMTGSVVLSYRVQDLGTETIHDLATHHDGVTVRRQTSGCAGTGDATTRMEIWFAPVKTGLACPERTSLQRTITTPRGCKITYQLQGDTDALTQVADQLPVRVKFFDTDGKDQGTLEMQDYDQGSLDDSLFAPPSGYRQVGAAEFARAESKSLYQGMTGGQSPLMPAQPGQSGAFPGQPATTGPGADGAFPQPTGGDAGTVNQSGAYPSPTPPAPAANP